MKRKALSLLTLALWSWACAPASSQQDGFAEIVFLDVGHGDAVLIRAPEGDVALMDAGPVSMGARLLGRGIDSLELAVATYPHEDHIGGMASVLHRIPTRFYLDNAVPTTSSIYSELMWLVDHSNATRLPPTAGRVTLGSASLTVLPPSPTSSGPGDGSLGLLLEYGAFRALFTGDSEVEGLQHFLELGVPDVTVLTAAGHGSRSGVSAAWLSSTNPDVVVISVGRGDAGGHPHPEALELYGTVTQEIYRTDLDGDVTIRGYRDGRYEVETKKAATLPPFEQ